jgi:hypothetical protein
MTPMEFILRFTCTNPDLDTTIVGVPLAFCDAEKVAQHPAPNLLTPPIARRALAG